VSISGESRRIDEAEEIVARASLSNRSPEEEQIFAGHRRNLRMLAGQ
jgi:hypothetical protein